MRGKRSKQYRKLMQQYGLYFGFREPYQVLVDAEILRDAARFKMDFIGGISKALHGQVKPMITQCCIRHLYESEAKDSIIIQHAKAFERRRCNHHELEQPLSALECLTSVVDPKGTKNNKHRYVVACQDEDLRSHLRSIPGVPLIYLKRSVLIMEPMPGVTETARDKDERAKFRSGLKARRNPGQGDKQKVQGGQLEQREIMDKIGLEMSGHNGTLNSTLPQEPDPPKKKRKRGPSGPNPLSMKKPKKPPQHDDATRPKLASLSKEKTPNNAEDNEDNNADAPNSRLKRKRRHKSGKETSDTPNNMQDNAELD